jgi:hypothetical protein
MGGSASSSVTYHDKKSFRFAEFSFPVPFSRVLHSFRGWVRIVSRILLLGMSLVLYTYYLCVLFEELQLIKIYMMYRVPTDTLSFLSLCMLVNTIDFVFQNEIDQRESLLIQYTQFLDEMTRAQTNAISFVQQADSSLSDEDYLVQFFFVFLLPVISFLCIENQTFSRINSENIWYSIIYW